MASQAKNFIFGDAQTFHTNLFMFLSVASKELGIISRGRRVVPANHEVSNNSVIIFFIEMNVVEEEP
jgi:hypothetical protein